MGRIRTGLQLLAITLVLTSCLTLTPPWPLVDFPSGQSASLVVIEGATRQDQHTFPLVNTGLTGWVPWIVDSRGVLLEFSVSDTTQGLDSLYIATNVAAGEYTLKGFLHIYADQSKMPKTKLPEYRPYQAAPYVVRQEFALGEPLVLTVESGHIATFGHYFIAFSRKGGAAVLSADRWKVDPASVHIEQFPADRKAVDLMATWTAPAWQAWLSGRTLLKTIAMPKAPPTPMPSPAAEAVIVAQIPQKPSASTAKPQPIESEAAPQSEQYLDFSIGGWQSLVVTQDGNLWVTGTNDRGQLGLAAKANFPKPTTVATDVVSLSAGHGVSWIVKQDGSLWGTGNNHSGSLGTGDTVDRREFVHVLDGVVSVSAGYLHSAALKTDGTLWTSGDNRSGQLGDGGTADRTTFQQVARDVVSASAGGFHTLYIDRSGTLYGCGENTKGQLGDGTPVSRPTPQKIMEGVKAAATGEYHTMILKEDGTLWACGYNEYGQLGDGTTQSRLKPVQVAEGVVAVSAGEMHTLYITRDGSLWAMGANTQGQLGDGTRVNKAKPVHVMDHVKAVQAAIEHTLVMDEDGRLWGFGSNAAGQLGDGSFNNFKTSPVLVFDLP